MICAGILPINQMRDYIGPAAIIASKVPQHLLEATYGMHITRNLDVKDNPDRPPNSHEMLNSYCALKGYITNGTGRWDEFRACKELLRDFNDGRLLYVAIPTSPSLDIRTDVWLSETEKVMMRRERVADRISLQKLDMASKAEKDTEQIVFGDNQFNEETGNEESSVSQDVEGGRREHKRLKHWGKKNKKLRDKDPYGDSVLSYAAYSTNRSVVPQGSSSTKGDSAFTRTVHPHHSSGGV